MFSKQKWEFIRTSRVSRLTTVRGREASEVCSQWKIHQFLHITVSSYPCLPFPPLARWAVLTRKNSSKDSRLLLIILLSHFVWCAFVLHDITYFTLFTLLWCWDVQWSPDCSSCPGNKAQAIAILLATSCAWGNSNNTAVSGPFSVNILCFRLYSISVLLLSAFVHYFKLPCAYARKPFDAPY